MTDGRDLFEAIGGAEEWMLEHSERRVEAAGGGRGVRRALTLLAAAVAVLAVSATALAAAGLDPAGWIAAVFADRDLPMTRAEVEAQVDQGQWICLNGDNIAAIVPEAPVRILLSADGGDTWRESTVAGSETMDAFGDRQDPAAYYGGWIGAFGDQGGYLVLTGGVALGRQPLRIYLTADGGETWRAVGDPYAAGVHDRVVTGAGFSAADTGFIGYRADGERGPDIWWTGDGGESWRPLAVTPPAGYGEDWRFTPLSPAFDGPEGTWPIAARSGEEERTLCLYTHDYGRTWSFG